MKQVLFVLIVNFILIIYIIYNENIKLNSNMKKDLEVSLATSRGLCIIT